MARSWPPRVAAVVIALCLASPAAGALGRKPKRTRSGRPGQAASAWDYITAAAELLTIHKPAHVYNMAVASERDSLADYLWTGDYISAAGRFTDANPALVSLFTQQAMDEADPRADNLLRAGKSLFPRFEFVLQHLFRSRSMRTVPFETAALSIQFLHHKVPRIAWDAVAQFSRSVMCRTWTEDFCELALARDPGMTQVPNTRSRWVCLLPSSTTFRSMRITVAYAP